MIVDEKCAFDASSEPDQIRVEELKTATLQNVEIDHRVSYHQTAIEIFGLIKALNDLKARQEAIEIIKEAADEAYRNSKPVKRKLPSEESSAPAAVGGGGGGGSTETSGFDWAVILIVFPHDVFNLLVSNFLFL